MLSFKKVIDRIDQNDRRFQAALECYLGSIMDVQEHAIEITPEITRNHQLTLRTLHRDLFEDLSVDALDKSRAVFLAALIDYRTKATTYHSQREEDLRSMVTDLAEAAETMSSYNDAHSARLKEFTEQLQVTARVTNLSQMRREINSQVSALRAANQTIWRENSSQVSEMQSRLDELQNRLELAERRAITDPLTGLLNRVEGETRLRRQIDKGQTTSVMLIDLNGFKEINDRWGHLCGDQILKVFSRNLEKLVRPSDTVCRWGGDEFVVILRNDASIAQERAQDLSEMIRARYKVVVIGKIFEVYVSASVGVAQACEGESVDELLARADSEMYQQKRTYKTVPSLPRSN